MAHIAGIKFEKDSKGRNKKIIIDLKKWGEYFDEFLDVLEAESRVNEVTFPFAEVKRELDKIHGLSK